MQLETVKIKHGEGFAVINKSDFKPSEHELFEEPVSEVATEPTVQLPDSLSTQLLSTPTIQVAVTPAKPAVKRLVKAKKPTP